MSSLTKRLNLIKPDGTDPFLLSDFTNNFNTIDSHPGIFICTSTTRPSWGVSQNGQLIFETDTRRTLMWNGTSWHDVQLASAAWINGLNYSADPIQVTSNQTLSFTIGNFKAPADGTMMFYILANLKEQRYVSFGVRLFPVVDGVYAGAFDPARGDESGELSQWHTYGLQGLWNDYRVISTVGAKYVKAGFHTVELKLETFQGSGSIHRISVLAFMTNTMDV